MGYSEECLNQQAGCTRREKTQRKSIISISQGAVIVPRLHTYDVVLHRICNHSGAMYGTRYHLFGHFVQRLELPR